jgi:hypothetical protein
MHPAITEVTPERDYVLSIVFGNGEKGRIDLKPILDFGVFRTLKDYTKFKQVRVSFDTIEWPGGIDLDPEYVYEKCVKQINLKYP